LQQVRDKAQMGGATIPGRRVSLHIDVYAHKKVLFCWGYEHCWG